MHRTMIAAVALAAGAVPAVAQLAEETGPIVAVAPSSIDALTPTRSRVHPHIIPTGRPEVSPRSAAFILTVLHHSDGESQLLGAPGNPDFGNVARFKTLMDNLRAEALADPMNDGIDRGVVVISSGDNYLPGPELTASASNGVPFFDTIALDAIDYDALVIGNHEFDNGPGFLADFISGFSTNVPAFLSANLDFSTEPALSGSGIVPSVIVTTGGQQVGIIGATTEDISFISSPGLVTINPVLAAVQAEITNLQNQGVDKIILASHLQDVDTGEVALLAQLDDVDAVVAGGSGQLFGNVGDLLVPGDSIDRPYPFLAPDFSGDQIAVVGTADDYKYIGRLVIEFDASGNVMGIRPESGPVRVSGIAPDAVTEDAGLAADVLAPVQAALDAQANNVIAISEVGLDGVRGNVRSQETNLGNLVAQSQLWTARTLASQFGVNQADVAIANGGGIRNDNVIPAGNITELDTFDILPFSNFVTVVEDVSRENFKELLENGVSNSNGEGSTGRFFQIAGFSVAFDVSFQRQTIENGVITQAGERIRHVFLEDGTPIVVNGVVIPGAPVNIATVNFLAGGGDQYPFPNSGTRLGVTYQRALFNYFEQELGGNITRFDAREGGDGRIIRLP